MSRIEFGFCYTQFVKEHKREPVMATMDRRNFEFFRDVVMPEVKNSPRCYVLDDGRLSYFGIIVTIGDQFCLS